MFYLEVLNMVSETELVKFCSIWVGGHVIKWVIAKYSWRVDK